MKKTLLISLAVFTVLVLLIFGLALAGYRGRNNTTVDGRTRQTLRIGAAPSPTATPLPKPVLTGLANKPLSLRIDSPAEGANVVTAEVAVKGQTQPFTDVFVDDKQTVSDKMGIFSANITLVEGANTITVIVNDADGNFTEKEINVFYDSGITE